MDDGAISAMTPEPFGYILGEGEELTLENAVFQTVGAASVCWVGGTGDAVFDDRRANQVAQRLIADLKSGLIPIPVRGGPEEVQNVIARADALDQRRQAQIANQKAAIDRLVSATIRLQDDLDASRRQSGELVTAIRLTAEYLGREFLPAIPGWSWYDALLKHAPAVAALFVQPTEEPS